METVKRRSESPFSRSKTKGHLSDTSENGNSVIEQVKRKKKSLRIKSKTQSNGKEFGDSENLGKDYMEEETTTNEADNDVASSNAEWENVINNGNGEGINNGNGEGINNENGSGSGQEEVHETDENNENDALVGACDSLEGNPVESNGKFAETEGEECKSTEAAYVEEESTENDCGNSETESGAKRDNLLEYESEVVCESSEGTCNGGTNDVSNGEANSTPPEDSNAECLEVKESSRISVNGSDGSSHYEEANATDEDIQASPDTATKDDNSFSNKITNFLGKWNYSQPQKPTEQNTEQKEEFEVSSSKKIEETLPHPYLSKVSGRRGIKERLNSSATIFSSKDTDMKTPDNSGKISLDDSFRVRTNPPRLHSLELTENPTLRKFKGKRCLNAGDEPEEDEDDIYLNTSKRRKLEEKSHETGLLGGILWSPFKKKAFESEDQTKLATAESKLSRLLSPFWFWKKTAAGQKGK